MKQINKLPKDYLILLSIIIVACVFSLIMTSCGAKTLNKEVLKTDSIAKEVEVVKTDCTSIENKEIKFDVVTDDVIIEPVDTTKPIEIINNEGKVTKYKNARISHKKRKDNTIVIEDKKVAKIVVDSLTNEIEVNKIESKKIVYKDQFSWGTFILDLWWLWLLILLVIYIAYRRYKGYPFI
jgi:hypothetical protein